MKKVIIALLFSASVFFAAALKLYCLPGDTNEDAMQYSRPIIISVPEVFNRLSFPRILFDHDRHSSRNGDRTFACEDCHSGYPDNRIFSIFPFDTEQDILTVTNGYHSFCNGCHTREDNPPQECMDCHDRNSEYNPRPWVSPVMSLETHNEHMVGSGGGCASCHHNISRDAPDNKSNFQCRSCHGREDADLAAAFSTVVHNSCIACHEDIAEKSAVSVCDTCHSAPGNPVPWNFSDVPRLEAGQKDDMLIHAQGATKPAVFFNHKAHEQSVRNCSACHHKNMEKCSSCHSLEGKPEGNSFRLANAFHELNSDHSCLGCHDKVKKAPECAICHDSMPTRSSDKSCGVCHSGKAPAVKERIDPDTLLPDYMPPEFTLGEKGGDHAPVSFHHRQMVGVVNRMIRGYSLAEAFHGDKAVICDFCHHKDSGKLVKRKCTACHPAEADPGRPEIPAIADSYHKRCGMCHIATSVTTPENCAHCHKNIER